MTFRNEKKIRVNSSKIYDLINWIDKNEGFQLYPNRVINSIYFDTGNFSMYSDSMEGVLPRKKIRLRNYNYKFLFDQNVKKEIKISSAEGRFKTSRIEKNPLNMMKLGYMDQDYGLCSPVINIVYERSYYKVKNIRLTLDQKIIYRRIYNSQISSFSTYDNSNVVELKFSSESLNNSVIKNFPFELSRFSKYCRGIEFIRNNYCNEL